MEKDKVLDQIPGTFQDSDPFFDNRFIEKRLLNYQEAAKYLCISQSYLRRLKGQRQVPFVPVGNRSVRFRISSLNQWIEKREMK